MQSNKTDDKPFVHFSNNTGLYYLSWGCFYGVGSNVYGPFTFRGSVIDVAHIAPDFLVPDGNMSAPWYKSQNLQCRRGSFLSDFPPTGSLVLMPACLGGQETIYGTAIVHSIFTRAVVLFYQ